MRKLKLSLLIILAAQLAAQTTNPTANVSISGTVTVAGNKTNNAAVPGATNVGGLTCLANAAAPSFTEGFLVLCSSDLAGNHRVLAQGVAASGATKAGNPLQIGGVFNTTQPTVTNGQAVEGQMSNRGSYLVTPGVEGFPVIGNIADGIAASGNPVRIAGKDIAGLVQDIATNPFGGLLPSSASAALADANSNSQSYPSGIDNSSATLISPVNKAYLFQFNGTTWDRVRTMALANVTVATTLTARNSIGAQVVEKGSRWMVVSTPAGGSQGTASIAAEASVRHVVDCVTFSATSSAAVTAAQALVNIRDGATGAGTIIWSVNVALPTAAAAGAQEIVPHTMCGLNLVGTTNTAMTAEFSAATTGVSQAVSISGFNVN